MEVLDVPNVLEKGMFSFCLCKLSEYSESLEYPLHRLCELRCLLSEMMKNRHEYLSNNVLFNAVKLYLKVTFLP